MDGLALVIMPLFTLLVLGVGAALFSLWRTRKAKKENEHSAIMDDPRMTHKEPRMPEGAQGPDGNPRPVN